MCRHPAIICHASFHREDLAVRSFIATTSARSRRCPDRARKRCVFAVPRSIAIIARHQSSQLRGTARAARRMTNGEGTGVLREETRRISSGPTPGNAAASWFVRRYADRCRPWKTRELDQIDKELLNLIQVAFPLESRPFAFLADKLGYRDRRHRTSLGVEAGQESSGRSSMIFDTRALDTSRR